MTRLFITISLVLCAFIIQGRSFPGNISGRPAAVASMQGKHARLSFIENKGQVMDQYRKPRTDIQFRVAAAPGLNIFIGNGAIHYQFSKLDSTTASVETQDFASLPHDGKALRHTSLSLGEGRGEASFTMYRMDVELIGANKNAQVITAEKQDYYENYFNENTNGRTVTAHTYNRITYKNIYPYIDWVLYISSGQLKHEFVVNEGGNAADIQLKYGGVTDMKLNTDGSLAAATPQGVITEQTPSCYQQDGKAVESNFKITGDLLTYEIGSYSGRLVIDPALVWATYFGGTGADVGNGVATDDSDNVYISGTTQSVSGIATLGAYQTIYGGGYDAFLAKFNSAGDIKWATYYGGSGIDYGYGIATDDTGNVYITGYTSSALGIATPGAYQSVYGGATDAFLAKFNGAGDVQWGTYYGGSGGVQGYGVTTDRSGNIYITGIANTSSGIATAGAYQTSYGGGTDAFLATFNSAGAMQWATYFGGSGLDEGEGVATDDSGHVYIVGYTQSTSGIATPGAYQVVEGDGGSYSDAFLAKFNNAGEIQWATYFGGSYYDDGSGVVADGSGNLYITGATSSTSNIATPLAYQDTLGGGNDVFLAKLNSAGAIQWATYYGGAGGDNGYGIATDSFGNVYVTGETTSPSGIATTGAYQDTLGGGTGIDAFLATFNGVGSLMWATYYGGSGTGFANQVATDNAGNAYITGQTQSTSDIATLGSYQSSYGGGGNDDFLAKFIFCTAPSAGLISGTDSVCIDSAITLTDTISSGIWSSANSAIATITAGMVRGQAAGLDTIKYTVSNACSTATAQKLIYVTDNCTEGISTISKSNDISIYPNPTQSEIIISSSSPIISIAITNLLGQVVRNQTCNAAQVQVDVAGLPAGVYFVRINGVEVRKFVKE